ncbi:SCAN domain-containing protein 3-like [Seriola dumerili]|uniref:SCAN domain-containing protein 3-like n=1 Tax=Seriola dumerili TaxID=41447 RepID=UPI000BBF1E33|nr:SCAN domain-containing protein 3-like [Seriola dumerili]
MPEGTDVAVAGAGSEVAVGATQCYSRTMEADKPLLDAILVPKQIVVCKFEAHTSNTDPVSQADLHELQWRPDQTEKDVWKKSGGLFKDGVRFDVTTYLMGLFLIDGMASPWMSRLYWASSSHQHRLLREFLKEMEADANDLLLHNNVRWLSKGNALGCFWSIQKEIAAFLQQLKRQKATQFANFLQDNNKMDVVAFLVDITGHLNKLNLKLQGQKNSVCDMMKTVHSFQMKLDIFKEDLQGECEHFPQMQEQIQGKRDISPYVSFIDKLIGNFCHRFDSFNLGHQLLLLIKNPFLIREIRGFSKEVTQTFKWAHPGSLQLELTDLQADVALREHFETTDSATFWLQIVPETIFPGLTKVALHTLTMFGSTYSCETAFSTMNIIKTK